MVFERAVVAGAGAGYYRKTGQRKAGGGLAGEEVDCAADGVGAVEGGAGAVEEVDAGDCVEGDGDVEVQVAGFGIVDAEAVDEDEGLLEGGAADGEVGLNAFAGAGLEVEGGVGAEEIDGAIGADGEIVGEDDLDRAVAFGERERLDGGGDLDAVDFDEFGLRRGGILLRWGRRLRGAILLPCARGALLEDGGAGTEQ